MSERPVYFEKLLNIQKNRSDIQKRHIKMVNKYIRQSQIQQFHFKIGPEHKYITHRHEDI